MFWRLNTLQHRLIAALLFALPAMAAGEEKETPSPRSLYLTGHYAEAAELYQQAAEKDAASALGLARCQTATGEYDEATETLTEAIQRDPKSAALLSELALLEFQRGSEDAARKHAEAVLALDKDSITARWTLAELDRTSGKLSEALKGYESLVSTYNRGSKVETSEEVRLIGLAAAQVARWNRNHNQFKRLVSEFYPSLLRREKDFWPAQLEMARLFAEKYNEADATTSLAAGLAINPSAAELHALKAEIAVSNFDLAGTKASLARATDINPRLLWAEQLRGDMLMADVRPAEAIEVLQEASKFNPRSEATRGRLAAAYAAVDGMPCGKPSQRMQAVIDEIEKHNPHCGEFYLAMGESFDRMRRYPLAAAQLRVAQEKMPQLLSVRGQLGMTLMRLGEEVEAAKLLEEAFTIDPYNVRVKNTLEVLDVLKGYAVLETDHFVLKFDRGQDELLARYASKYLEEEVYPQLVEQYGFKPEGKTLIEIFSRNRNTSGHGWFSARMVGLPAIGTVGACAGKMVAITTPDELPKKYDWARVLRHEYVHVLNLQQTDFNIPHWFTEGLAVHSEGPSRPREWNVTLAERAREKTLYNLDTITLGFIRPKNSEDWTLAYCQAALFVDYTLESYGKDATAKMLAAYAEHLSTPQVLKKCFAVEQAEFEIGYRKFVDGVIAKSANGQTKETRSLAELQKIAEDKNVTARTLAELARANLERKANAEARKWALAAQKKDAAEPLAAYVLARLQLLIGDTDAAIGMLMKAVDEDNPQEDVLTLLAHLTLKAEDLAEAEKLYLLGEKHFPASDRWARGLARIYWQEERNEKLLPVLTKLANLEPDNLPLRKKPAQLALAAKDFRQARNWATQIIHLDLQDAEGHALLAAAAVGMKEFGVASEEYKTALNLSENHNDWRLGLAEALAAGGKKEEARAAAEALQDKEPDYPGLQKLLESLKL
ncbi:MAG: tetratricopeptide repeat protein [Pirellulaceae bacterium]|nr:tetratricopeptide repeat protein [Pirellulaceae bacterium]